MTNAPSCVFRAMPDKGQDSFSVITGQMVEKHHAQWHLFCFADAVQDAGLLDGYLYSQVSVLKGLSELLSAKKETRPIPVPNQNKSTVISGFNALKPQQATPYARDPCYVHVCAGVMHSSSCSGNKNADAIFQDSNPG